MKNIIKLSLSMIFLVYILCSYGQSTNYRSIEGVPTYVKKYNAVVENKKILSQYKFVDATMYLPKGHVKNGTEDYTSYIQVALNSNQYVLMPNFPISINDKGLDIQNNQIILFQKDSKIKLIPSRKTNYEILRIRGKRNIKIYSPVIEGDRDSHLGKTGEWGMGISIISSSNVLIVDLKVTKCWGDGIYVGQKGGVNNNIILKYGLVDYNRRNGISVISANGLEISNLIVSNSLGTNPQAGLDFEPNNIKEDLKAIKVYNSYFFNNKKYGVVINSSQISEGNKDIDLLFENVKSSYTEAAFSYTSKRAIKNKNSKIGGKIIYRNIDFNDAVIPFKMNGRASSDAVDISITSPKSARFNKINDSKLKIVK